MTAKPSAAGKHPVKFSASFSTSWFECDAKSEKKFEAQLVRSREVVVHDSIAEGVPGDSLSPSDVYATASNSSSQR